MRILACLALASALLACQSAPEAPAPYRLVDLTDDYAAFYDRTQAMPAPERVAVFRAEFNAKLPGFYDSTRTSTDERYNARVARSFERFPEQREAIARTAAAFAGALAPAHESFKRVFPDIAPIGDLYLVHSLGEMDGGTRDLDGKTTLIFGADVMAAAHPFTDETPFFHHELFHIYHSQVFRGCEALWCGLWTEGLAVYAAATLNPNASDAQLLLSSPEPLRQAVEAHRAEAVCAARARLDSRTEQDLGAFLSSDRLNERLPPRFGYYVGYLAAEEAAKSRALADLARLPLAEARPVLEASLAALAACPAS